MGTNLWINAQNKKTGKHWIVSLDWLAEELAKTGLKQKLGICVLSEYVDSQAHAINALEEMVILMLMPQARVTIINKLKENPLNTIELKKYINTRTPKLFSRACAKVFEQLIAEKVILFLKQSKGHPRIWFLTDDPLALTQSKEES